MILLAAVVPTTATPLTNVCPWVQRPFALGLVERLRILGSICPMREFRSTQGTLVAFLLQLVHALFVESVVTRQRCDPRVRRRGVCPALH